MPLSHNIVMTDPLRVAIAQAYRQDESTIMDILLDAAKLNDKQLANIKSQSAEYVAYVRQHRADAGGIDAFMKQYDLSSEEGVALMCLAEAMLRVPDKATVDELIKDKITPQDWGAYRGQSQSTFVNATTWALMLTGKVLKNPKDNQANWTNVMRNFISKRSEGVIRKAVAQAMKIMSKQFVMGRNIQEAIKRAVTLEEKGYRYSYDMLGEAAMTEADALRYHQAYMGAIHSIGKKSEDQGVIKGPGISIKLSALYSRYEVAKRDEVLAVLTERVITLAEQAKAYDIGFTIDAEETNRLDLSLDIIEKVFSDSRLANWYGLGVAVQSYQKRAFYVLDWLAALSKRNNKRIMVRLIKGAYWDTEIKQTQMEGLTEYPVFTYKTFTDVSFQACAKKLFNLTEFIYPQFATHNAYSVALILELAGSYRDFEFQCLHGMGQELYEQITPAEKQGIPCRIYAPVGSHEDLLPYLVRRLLENGANSSFVNRIVDDKADIDDLVQAPVVKAQALVSQINKHIPLPDAIFADNRNNSQGFDISDYLALSQLRESLTQYQRKHWQGHPCLSLEPKDATKCASFQVTSPAENARVIGAVRWIGPKLIDSTFVQGKSGFQNWQNIAVDERAECLEKLAHLLEDNKEELFALLMLEAGKVLPDAIAEVREAIDFCRYYAIEARKFMQQPTWFKGYTGETNQLSYSGRGVMICISPWNFPLAIFLGQIVACLVTGNSVIAKPAEQSVLIATMATKLMYEAGIPKDVMQLAPGQGATIGAKLVQHNDTAGVLFTGSTQTAKVINQTLSKRQGAIVPLIAETGGQNAMIVDSSALLEQVTRDVIQSSFGSAGQRCSALRVLYVQSDIYEKLKTMLCGAMEMLDIGKPYNLKTDLGPVIDKTALQGLRSHIQACQNQGLSCFQVPLASDCVNGYFIPPTLVEIKNINDLKKEHFGPILHILPYEKSKLDQVIDDINQVGYGLTLGIHSRIQENVSYIASKVHVGNCYVNRNMTGAVVGLQPFGGEGLSGTGPKAGGPNYLRRLCHERTITIDTTAAGGNASLMAEVVE